MEYQDDVTGSACSDDESIDFEHELSTDAEDDMPVDQLSSDKPFHIASTASRFSKFIEFDQSEGVLNATDVKTRNLTKLSEEPEFKLIGQPTVGRVSNPTTVVSPWIKEAVRFSAAINIGDQLSSLESIPGLANELLLELRKIYHVWFPVQQAVLPGLLQSSSKVFSQRDLVVTAPTVSLFKHFDSFQGTFLYKIIKGTGKTLCFVLPILNSVRSVQEASAVFALCIAPVKDLAQQIFQEFCKYNVFGIRIVLLNGVSDYESERNLLFPSDAEAVFGSQVHVIVATPGRLMEHLTDPSGVINLSTLRFLVVDEADRMLDTARVEWLGVVERRAKASINNLTVDNLLKSSQNRWLQKILVSATLSLDVEKLHMWNLRCPKLFEADSRKRSEVEALRPIDPNQAHLILPSSLSHQVIVCMPTMKPAILFDFLDARRCFKKVIIFVNHRDSSQRLSLLLGFLARGDFSIAEMSSNLSGKRRFKTMRRFQDGQTRVLIASDVLSRGIDICGVDLVVNYDTPINERIFFHRAGRTARALSGGVLLSLVTKEERMRLKKLLVGSGAWTEDITDRRDNTQLSKSVLKKYEKALKKLRQKCV